MRQKATNLEVGKWYADGVKAEEVIFLRFHSFTDGMPNFDLASEESYIRDDQGLIGFISPSRFYLVSKKDVEKYNLR